MNIIRIDKNNMVNGTGLRTVIWCAGCEHRCPYCQNHETWDPNVGTPVGQWVYDELRSQLNRDEISGVTFSGGECTYPANIEEATKIMKWIKDNYPSKNIWIYSGYTYEVLSSLKMMEYVDVLVDGPYIHDKNPGTGRLKWRGSSNQRVIDIKKTRENGFVTWVRDFNGKFIYENENQNED